MFLILTALLVAAEPAAAAVADAASGPAAPATAAPPVKKAKDQVICWDETPTGTRFSHRVCATREQLEQRRRDDQDWKMWLRPTPAGGN